MQEARHNGCSIKALPSLLHMLHGALCAAGYDASAHVSEESRGAARTAPRAIILCIGISGMLPAVPPAFCLE
jgi:amino acid transporter